MSLAVVEKLVQLLDAQPRKSSAEDRGDIVS
jgi:hypothetical protein